jgi:hypothetical protein
MRPEAVQVAESLREKLEEAQASYRRATDEYKRLMSISRETSSLNDPALVDGLHAMRRAIVIHEQARLEYQQALKAFNDFILDGKVPPSGPDS